MSTDLEAQPDHVVVPFHDERITNQHDTVDNNDDASAHEGRTDNHSTEARLLLSSEEHIRTYNNDNEARWIQEKRQLLERIDTLTKQLSDAEFRVRQLLDDNHQRSNVIQFQPEDERNPDLAAANATIEQLQKQIAQLESNLQISTKKNQSLAEEVNSLLQLNQELAYENERAMEELKLASTQQMKLLSALDEANQMTLRIQRDVAKLQLHQTQFQATQSENKRLQEREKQLQESLKQKEDSYLAELEKIRGEAAAQVAEMKKRFQERTVMAAKQLEKYNQQIQFQLVALQQQHQQRQQQQEQLFPKFSSIQ
eukprot:GEZU01019107.1.p1 GENE.GEZU01019107.1~~GEZU01019107.1.p1  ORF type:complete len:312 (-),score=85.54 GEZU01019107.1:35-970(-)